MKITSCSARRGVFVSASQLVDLSHAYKLIRP